MTNAESALGLSQLINNLLVVRKCALTLAISDRDGDLAAAVTDGDDCLIHDLLITHMMRAQEAAEKADVDAQEKLKVKDGRAPIRGLEDILNVLDLASEVVGLKQHATVMSQLCDLIADTIAMSKMDYPFVLDKTAAELIDLLKAEEDKQQEAGSREQAKAEAAADQH